MHRVIFVDGRMLVYAQAATGPGCVNDVSPAVHVFGTGESVVVTPRIADAIKAEQQRQATPLRQ